MSFSSDGAMGLDGEFAVGAMLQSTPPRTAMGQGNPGEDRGVAAGMNGPMARPVSTCYGDGRAVARA